MFQYLFRFADGDAKAMAKTLHRHEDELNRVLKDTVPGLVTGSADGGVQATLSVVGTDDRMIGPGQHHRLLVRPDASHVSVLFHPTLVFLQRVAEVLPSGLDSAQQSGAVMDDFVLKVYLPQLEDKVTALFLNAVNGNSTLIS
jgi:exocyst complex component 4